MELKAIGTLLAQIVSFIFGGNMPPRSAPPTPPAAIVAPAPAPERQQPAAPPTWVSGFYVGYMSDTYPPSAIDVESLTHVFMFAAVPDDRGGIDLRFDKPGTAGPALAKDVARHAHAAQKKALLTVGGSQLGATLAHATRPESIDRLTYNLVQATEDLGFDGIDIDWEPLTPEDYPSFLSLVAKLKTAKPDLIITADIPWRKVNERLTSTDVSFYRQLAPLLDQMNIMTYEMTDNWGGWMSWHSSALTGADADHPSSVVGSVTAYTDAGIPAAKLGIGIGFFGSCWNAPTTAPRQPLTSSRVIAGDNEISITNIKNVYAPRGTFHYDAAAQAPYLSFPKPTGPHGCTFISYENEQSIAAKGAYARDTGLGGTIVWQLNEGYDAHAEDPNGMLRAVARAFLKEK